MKMAVYVNLDKIVLDGGGRKAMQLWDRLHLILQTKA